MVTNNRAPTQRYQDWPTILFVTMAGFCFVWFATAFATWTWFTQWSSLSHHLHYWWMGAIDLFMKREPNAATGYWQKVSDAHHQIDFYIHFFMSTLAASLSGVACGRLFYTPGGRDSLMHISGPRLYKFAAAIKHAKNCSQLECRNAIGGLLIHPNILLSKLREAGNFLVIGQQGAGKTVFIILLITQILQRPAARTFIYDEKREFTSLFFNTADCWLIAPWDARSAQWDIQADASTAESAQLLSEILIPQTDEPLWSNAARIIFAGMIEVLNKKAKKWGWRELSIMIALEEGKLASLLGTHYQSARRLVKEDSKTTFSFLVQIQAHLGWVSTLARAWPHAHENGFSINRWLKQGVDKRKTVIVQADKRFRNIGAPIASAMITLLTSNILSQANSSQRDLWLLLDEIANLPKTPALLEWMSLGRSKGCRMVAGTQSIAQLREIYGHDMTDGMLNMFANVACMRLGSTGDTATYMSKAFGERCVERPSYSFDSQGQSLVQWQRDTMQLVTAADLTQLPQANAKGVEGYLLVPGWESVYRLRWPITKIVARAAEHQPAAWLANSRRKISQAKSDAASPTRRDVIKSRRDVL